MNDRTTRVKIYFDNPYSPHEFDYPETDGYMETREENTEKALNRFDSIREDVTDALAAVSWCTDFEIDDSASLAGFPADVVETTLIEADLAGAGDRSKNAVTDAVYEAVASRVDDATVKDVVIATPQIP